ncbi:MAG: ribosome small subunit-dependent GTPase A [Bacillota bacterium]
MATGQVVRLHGGYYYVLSHESGEIQECVRRGRLARERLLVGDYVVISEVEPGKCTIEELVPRRTRLLRPPVANVEQSLIVVALRDPKPNFRLLDRFLLVSGAASVEPVLCFNKIDLVPSNAYSRWIDAYKSAGYSIVLTSAKTGEGLDALRAALVGRVTVVAGPSGVGKSTLLNAIQPGLQLKTGEISKKTGRGRHITRLVELLPLQGGGVVVDTPGFTQLNLPDIPAVTVARYFPEISRLSGNCRFNNCLHNNEPDCAVRKAVGEGRIPAFRYRHYQSFLSEAIEKERG